MLVRLSTLLASFGSFSNGLPRHCSIKMCKIVRIASLHLGAATCGLGIAVVFKATLKVAILTGLTTTLLMTIALLIRKTLCKRAKPAQNIPAARSELSSYHPSAQERPYMDFEECLSAENKLKGVSAACSVMYNNSEMITNIRFIPAKAKYGHLKTLLARMSGTSFEKIELSFSHNSAGINDASDFIPGELNVSDDEANPYHRPPIILVKILP